MATTAIPPEISAPLVETAEVAEVAKPSVVEAAKPSEVVKPVAAAEPSVAAKPSEPVKETTPTQPAKPQDKEEAKPTTDPAKSEEIVEENKMVSSVQPADKASSEEPPPSKTLFVSNISWKVKAKDLREPFSAHGDITDCKIVNYYDKSENRVKSKGYGFVTFKTEEDAAVAKEKLQGHLLQERDLVLKFSTSSGPKGKSPKKAGSDEASVNEQKGEEAEAKEPEVIPDGYRTIFLKTFPYKVTEDDVKGVFKDFGKPEKVAIVNRRSRGKMTGLRAFAFVTFPTHDLAKKVYEASQAKVLKHGEKELVVQVSRKQPGDEKDDKEKEEGQKGTTEKGKKSGGRKRLYVSGLTDMSKEKALEEKFKTFGNVSKCQVKEGKNPEKPITFAYVNFVEPEHAAKALEAMNGTDFEGNKLVVEYARR